MRHRSIPLFAACSLLIALAACSKMTNPYYANGNTPTFNSTVSSVKATPADSLTTAVVFSWTNPHYATDSSTVLYIIQLDSSGHGFVNPMSITVYGTLFDSVTAKQINTMVLAMGGTFGQPYTLEVRLVSSYANNNEQLVSNSVSLQVTPYKTPPKVVPPASGAQLFLVGNATQGGWNNPVPVPTQALEEVDSVDWGGVFNLIGGEQYLILPVNGDWTNKYATNDATPGPTGGTFGYNASTNFTGPLTSGWYTIIMSFQTGTISVAPYGGTVPANLYIVGNATPGGWNNPVPVPSQQLTQTSSSSFTVTLPMIGGDQYLLLPVNGDWTNKYAVGSSNDTVSGGTFGYNFSNNFTGPANSGTYTVTADFLTWTYTVQ